MTDDNEDFGDALRKPKQPHHDPRVAQEDLAVAHGIIAKCHAAAADPFLIVVQNIRWYVTAMVILCSGDKAAVAAHLRLLADHLDPQGTVEATETLLDQALKRK